MATDFLSTPCGGGIGNITSHRAPIQKSPRPTCSSGERGHGRSSTQEQSTADPRTPTFIELFAEATTPPLLAGLSRWKEKAEKATKQSDVTQRDVR